MRGRSPTELTIPSGIRFSKKAYSCSQNLSRDCFASLAMTLRWASCHCEEQRATKQSQLTSIEQRSHCRIRCDFREWLVRQAKLGVSFRGESPCRVRPNQPPVSSVADMVEEVNYDRTRYPKRTQRILWAAGKVAPPQAIQPRYLVRTGGDGFSVPEANTKGS